MKHKNRKYGKRNKCVVPSEKEKIYLENHIGRIEAKHISQIKGINLWEAEPGNELYVLDEARYIDENPDHYSNIEEFKKMNRETMLKSYEEKRIYNKSTDRFLKVENRNGYARVWIQLKNGDKVHIPVSSLVGEVFAYKTYNQGTISKADYQTDWHHISNAKTEDGYFCNDWYNLKKVPVVKKYSIYDEHSAIHNYRDGKGSQIVCTPFLFSSADKSEDIIEENADSLPSPEDI